jgi:uncharacterized membrane protein
MTGILLLALVLGISSGLRTFTAPAAVLWARGSTVWAIILTILALFEFYADTTSKIPARTTLPSTIGRLISGAFVGWMVSTMHGGTGIAGAIAGIVGAIIGTYGGYAARIAAIKRIGSLPAAISEDLVAIALAVVAVTR